MKTLAKKLTAGCVLVAALGVNAATVTVDPGATWLGYMNVFNLPASGTYPTDGLGAYQFQGSWGVADLRTSWSGPVLSLSPNTIGDPNEYWYTPSGGPGATGNKLMAANFYVETTGLFTGQTITFEGTVLDTTLLTKQDANGNGWFAQAFIKDFAPDYSSFVSQTMPLANGTFSFSLNTLNDPSRHIQWGFELIGPDVWATDVEPFGSIQVTAVPEPGTFALLALGLLPLALRRRA